jgi:hypothetical protein
MLNLYMPSSLHGSITLQIFVLHASVQKVYFLIELNSNCKATDYVYLDNLHLKTTQVNNDIKIVQARKENQSGQIKQLAKQRDNLEVHVKVNQEAYTKASQALPTGTPLYANNNIIWTNAS